MEGEIHDQAAERYKLLIQSESNGNERREADGYLMDWVAVDGHNCPGHEAVEQIAQGKAVLEKHGQIH